jgi:CheY-like chemotaxis protein
LKLVLESAGAIPVVAEDADTALEVVQQRTAAGQPLDLVVFGTGDHLDPGFGFSYDIRQAAGEDVKLLVLTSSGQRGDGARCRRSGIHGYLSKPVSRADFLETVIAVLQGTEVPSPPELITRHTVKEARRSLSILVAEDNPVNQEVAETLLRRRGHEVTVVDNGADAVAATAATDYDVILMDIQMPVLDGYGATREIRQRTEGGKVPILAMTAHVLEGERQRVRDAGMNGYIAKPFEPHELFAAIEGWGSSSVAPVDESGRSDESTVDLVALRTMLREGGVEDAYEGMIELFLDDGPRRVAALEAALDPPDCRTIVIESHTLKSAAATVRARKLVRLLQQLEDAGNAADAARATPLVAGVKAEFAAVQAAMLAARAA